MRRRLRSCVVAAALLATLTACTPASPAPSPTPSESTAQVQVNSGGDRLDGVEVAGETGREPEVSVTGAPPSAPEATDIQRSIVEEGDGAPLTADDTVVIVVASYTAATGSGVSAYGSLGPATKLSNPELPAFVAPLFDGVPDGSRVVASVPIDLVAGEGASGEPVLIVADVVRVEAGASADGAATGDSIDYATVSDSSGEPEVTIDVGATPPSEQATAVVMQGDGEAVEDGDTVIVQYSQYLLADGTRVDTSWDDGLPPAFPTSMVVPGVRDALVGQQVGSRVVTVIPPELGYGAQQYGPIPGGSTLVFVADILALV